MTRRDGSRGRDRSRSSWRVHALNSIRWIRRWVFRGYRDRIGVRDRDPFFLFWLAVSITISRST
jgi:hypothetical protein